ncbi:hypothetical protein [Paraurantiacibacter namhicola]|uniref:Uncharacterized protein n=1 Tax=Paraurantiacibacter namhicola TaxID=645517 RepID=A0A1C7D8C1_9SPHN|nr:hypothetical protein [Paraurantiacibacter namhicola]ANU07724.1 hypothetical protein A6F65_01419 [Paraurantiacibacter namhicola]
MRISLIIAAMGLAAPGIAFAQDVPPDPMQSEHGVPDTSPPVVPDTGDPMAPPGDAERQAAYDSWSPERQGEYTLWSEAAQDYFWTLSEQRKEWFWLLVPDDRIALLAMQPEQREMAWTRLEQRVKSAPPEAEPETSPDQPAEPDGR